MIARTFVGVRSAGRDSNEKPKSHFVVKVQIPMMDDGGAPLSIYNKDTSFQTMLYKENNEYVHEELVKNIKEKGFHGLKGYFQVIFKADNPGRFKINSSMILPNEAW